MTAKLTNHCTCTSLTTNIEKWKYVHSLYNTKSEMIDNMAICSLACRIINTGEKVTITYNKIYYKKTKAFTADLHANVKDN